MKINCVEVYQDDLESEAMTSECVGSMLRIMWEAASKTDSDISNEMANACWLLVQTMDTHTMLLRRAADGKLNGPKMPEVGGAA